MERVYVVPAALLCDGLHSRAPATSRVRTLQSCVLNWGYARALDNPVPGWARSWRQSRRCSRLGGGARVSDAVYRAARNPAQCRGCHPAISNNFIAAAQAASRWWKFGIPPSRERQTTSPLTPLSLADLACVSSTAVPSNCLRSPVALSKRVIERSRMVTMVADCNQTVA